MFEEKTIRETCIELQGDKKNGLTEQEAQARVQKNGKNELKEEKKPSVAGAFLEQINDPLICVLLIAATISFLLHEAGDATIILLVVVVNACIGVIQEGKAQKALDALRKLTSPVAVVKRDGRQIEIPAADLVVGDIVCLDAGRQVPADLRLVQTSNLKLEESALTGESLPIEKDALFLADRKLPIAECRNMAFMSTMVTYGRGAGIVAATGMDTEIGKIAAIINEAPKEFTPLQKRLADLGKMLSIVSVLLCVALFGIALWQKRNVVEMLITAISLAVAAVPEGLPAIVTIVLALSVSKMVKVHTIIRKLPSVETLGAVSVVCSDKTGTLTQNKMAVTKCYQEQRICESTKLEVEKSRAFLECMTLCNDGVIEGEADIGDPTELALLRLTQGYHVSRTELEKKLPRIQECAFDSERKMMTTMHQTTREIIAYTKGAADEILKRCTGIYINKKIVPMTELHRRKICMAVEEMSGQALRVLAAAMKEYRQPHGNALEIEEQGLVFLGLAGMIDPARPEAAQAVETFRQASVTTIMVTGDHVDTAFAIAKQLGIAKKMNECMTGEVLQNLSDQELKKQLRQIRVFARVAPEHKVHIVKMLKACGNIVAMTGDGVNDAPSLKTADIGIAMGMSGTDVAKNAADMILTDDNFATIEKAIEEGRGIYENIKKSVLFLLSSNFGEIITMFTAVLFGLASPLKASHILWINLITDSLPALALGVDENDKKSMMRRPPRKAKESLFAGGGITCTLFYGILIALISLTAFLKIPYGILMQSHMGFSLANISAVLQTEGVLNHAQTYAFTVLGLSQLFHAVGMRDVRKSVFRMNHLENKLMLAAFGVGFALQAAVTEVPYLIALFGTTRLAPAEWIHLVILAAFPLVAHEIIVLTSWEFGSAENKKENKKTK